MSKENTNSKKIGISEKIGNVLETIRNIFAYGSNIFLWIGNYFAFVIVISLVVGSMLGIWNATGEMLKAVLCAECITNQTIANQTNHQTPNNPKNGDSLYPHLIKIAEYYLISFTLFLIAIGIYKIISGGISKEITKIEHLESLMIGLVVITMAVIFLDTIFGVATKVIVGVESVLMFGLAMAVVIVGLALYLKFREGQRSKIEVYSKLEAYIYEFINKFFTEKEKEIEEKLKEELKKAMEEKKDVKDS